MTPSIRQITDASEKSRISALILNALPDWFGQPASVEEYVNKSRAMPFWAAFSGDVPIGFIAMNVTSPDAAEIYVMGVLQSCHRTGAGRRLYAALEAHARANGYSFIQVKTVQMGRYREYDVTNRFYMAWASRRWNASPRCGTRTIHARYTLNTSHSAYKNIALPL